MRVVIATAQVPFIRGGAEVHAENLCAVLRNAGHQAEIVGIPFKWYPAERILDAMLTCRLLDLTEANGQKIDLLIGLKFPAYLIPHPNKVLWILHQHRSAYDQWDHPFGGLVGHPNAVEVRAAIHRADRHLIPEAKRVYTNSQNVSTRLARFCGIPSTPLYHPPLHCESFRTEPAENYLFLPSRITPSKRQLLAIQALGKTQSDVSLIISGEHEDPTYAREIERTIETFRLQGRVQFVGRVTEEQKLDLFARSLAVLYPPLDEDYGYVTLEAMLAHKPVITCKDSGGPLEFLIDRVTGIVVDPEPNAMAAAIDELVSSKTKAAAMGDAGFDEYVRMDISWDAVVDALTG